MFDDGYFFLNYNPQDLDSTEELNFPTSISSLNSQSEKHAKGELIKNIY